MFICGDPNCPNERTIDRLEKEIVQLENEINRLRKELDERKYFERIEERESY